MLIMNYLSKGGKSMIQLGHGACEIREANAKNVVYELESLRANSRKFVSISSIFRTRVFFKKRAMAHSILRNTYVFFIFIFL